MTFGYHARDNENLGNLFAFTGGDMDVFFVILQMKYKGVSVKISGKEFALCTEYFYVMALSNKYHSR